MFLSGYLAYDFQTVRKLGIALLKNEKYCDVDVEVEDSSW